MYDEGQRHPLKRSVDQLAADHAFKFFLTHSASSFLPASPLPLLDSISRYLSLFIIIICDSHLPSISFTLPERNECFELAAG